MKSDCQACRGWRIETDPYLVRHEPRACRIAPYRGGGRPPGPPGGRGPDP